MNNFDKTFFKKYVPEGQEILGIVHEHFIVIIDRILVNLFFGVLLPVFLYIESGLIQEKLPFEALEGLLFLVFFKTIYDVFDRYNDVWIITDSGVVDLEWALLDTSNVSLKHDNIEGIEVEQKGIWDTILGKGDLIIHKIGEGDFRLNNAITPYKAVDEIEAAGTGNFGNDMDFEEEDMQEDRFDKMMNILSEMVEDHMEKKGKFENEKNEQLEEKKQKLKRKSGTIDLSE
ncbi:MAG: hypothetical protein N4A38_02150 [Candidatus Gracilibacteria bacterium]|nr:hypothetical protein [Candidatus Gracilibacteria bacterium]